MVAYNNKKYYIDIIEAKPANAITIIETDCEVDFAPPLDYKEPEKPTSLPSSKLPVEGQILQLGICVCVCVLYLRKWLLSSLLYFRS